MALLAVLVIGLLHSTRMDLLVVKHYGDRIQAHYLALAGVEKARALLYQDATTRREDGKNHTGELYDSQQNFRDALLGRGTYKVFRRSPGEENTGIIYGISDEESRLNLNTASAQELGKLRDMTPEIAGSILEWRRSPNSTATDSNPMAGAANDGTSSGAGIDYYTSLQPPRLPRNGPFQTTRELLMVRGVTRKLMLGSDYKQNGLLDSLEENEPSDSAAGPEAASNPPSSPSSEATPSTKSSKTSSAASSEDSSTDTGWNGLLTVDSLVSNQSASGTDRVNIQTADEGSLAAVQGLTPEIAKAIVEYRGKKRFQNLTDLLDVTAAQDQSQTGRISVQPASSEPVISQELFQQIADNLTLASDREQAGLVNINTASADVLNCLPGLTPEMSQSIVSYRQSSGYFQNTASLLQVPGVTREILQVLLPRITARSETFRIISEGKVLSTGARQRIQAIVRVTVDDVITLSYREDL